jgi:hypothetical protein
MKIFKVLLGLFVLINWQCAKDDKILFDLNYEVKVPLTAGMSSTLTHNFNFFDLQTFYKASLKANGYTDSQIKTIEPASAFLLSLDSGNVFDFVQEVSVRISDNEIFNKEYFYTIQVPLNAGDRLDLVGTLVDAKEYLQNDRFNVRVIFKLRADCPSTFEAKLGMKFIVK